VSILSDELQDFFENRRQILALYNQRGRLNIYRSISGRNEDELLFVLSSDDEAKMEDMLRLRAQMRNPHLGRLNEVGMLPQGEGYWVCRLDLASRFDELLAERNQNPARILRLMSHVLMSLEEIHRHGRCHGDLRPGNIWVRINAEGQEEAFVVGMALDLWMQENIRQQASSMEIARYMAPERSIDGTLSPASDIYSLGILLYRALLRSYPFDGADPYAISAAHATTSLSKPALDHPIDTPFWDQLAACLSKDPGGRPNATELLEAFQPYLTHSVEIFQRPSPPPLLRQTGEPTLHELDAMHRSEDAPGDFSPGYGADPADSMEDRYDPPSDEPLAPSPDPFSKPSVHPAGEAGHYGEGSVDSGRSSDGGIESSALGLGEQEESFHSEDSLHSEDSVSSSYEQSSYEQSSYEQSSYESASYGDSLESSLEGLPRWEEDSDEVTAVPVAVFVKPAEKRVEVTAFPVDEPSVGIFDPPLLPKHSGRQEHSPKKQRAAETEPLPAAVVAEVTESFDADRTAPRIEETEEKTSPITLKAVSKAPRVDLDDISPLPEETSQPVVSISEELDGYPITDIVSRNVVQTSRMLMMFAVGFGVTSILLLILKVLGG
jgi:serine/threonine protein kinase